MAGEHCACGQAAAAVADIINQLSQMSAKEYNGIRSYTTLNMYLTDTARECGIPWEELERVERAVDKRDFMRARAFLDTALYSCMAQYKWPGKK